MRERFTTRGIHSFCNITAFAILQRCYAREAPYSSVAILRRCMKRTIAGGQVDSYTIDIYGDNCNSNFGNDLYNYDNSNYCCY